MKNAIVGHVKRRDDDYVGIHVLDMQLAGGKLARPKPMNLDVVK